MYLQNGAGRQYTCIAFMSPISTLDPACRPFPTQSKQNYPFSSRFEAKANEIRTIKLIIKMIASLRSYYSWRLFLFRFCFQWIGILVGRSFMSIKRLGLFVKYNILFVLLSHSYTSLFHFFTYHLLRFLLSLIIFTYFFSLFLLHS